MKRLINRQRSRYEERASEQDRIPPGCRDNFLYRNVQLRVTHEALRRAMDQEKQALDILRDNTGFRPNCTGLFSKQHGIPCKHKLVRNLEAEQPLNIRDFHQYWHHRQLPLPEDELSLRLVQDPAIQPTRRRVGPTRHDVSTRRDFSHDELRRDNRRQATANTAAAPPTTAAPQPHARRNNSCGICRDPSHNRRRCPMNNAART